jgi:urease accessory protein
VQVEKSAHALLTTPGATKLYRSAGATAELEQRLSVEAGGCLEWFPQETIAFSGVKAETALSVRLADDGDAVSGHASFVGWDIVCLGRPGSGERFDAGKLVSSVEIHRHQHPIYCDRLEVDGGSRVLDAAWGLRGAPVLGTLLAVVPALAFRAVQAWVSTVGRALGAQPAESCEWRGVSALPDPRNQGMKSFGGVVLARYLGVSAERAKSWFVELWRELRPLLTGRQACVPRIWAT